MMARKVKTNAQVRLEKMFRSARWQSGMRRIEEIRRKQRREWVNPKPWKISAPA